MKTDTKNMLNLRIIFADGREDLIVACPTNYGNHWAMFQYLSELLRTRCIHEDEIKDVEVKVSA